MKCTARYVKSIIESSVRMNLKNGPSMKSPVVAPTCGAQATCSRPFTGSEAVTDTLPVLDRVNTVLNAQSEQPERIT